MRALLVISLEIPNPEALPDIITHIDPPSIPGFIGELRIVPGDKLVSEVISFLEDE